MLNLIKFLRYHIFYYPDFFGGVSIQFYYSWYPVDNMLKELNLKRTKINHLTIDEMEGITKNLELNQN